MRCSVCDGAKQGNGNTQDERLTITSRQFKRTVEKLTTNSRKISFIFSLIQNPICLTGGSKHKHIGENSKKNQIVRNKRKKIIRNKKETNSKKIKG